MKLIYINISIDSSIIFWNFSNCHLIESSIVHIFDNHIIILYSSNDTNMSIIPIVSSTRKLYYRTNYWRRSCFFSLCSCISNPRTCITTPSYILILCNIPSTISSDKTSRFTSILYQITTLESCFWWDSYRWCLLCNLRIVWISIFCSSFCEGSLSILGIIASFICWRCFSYDSSRDHQIHTNTNTRSITEHINWYDICSINTIFGGNSWDGITRNNAMYYTRNWRNLENLVYL